MLSKVEAVNYRCLRNISQPLGRFHVLAGPNGSGKSTFLEVLRVLGAYAAQGLDAVWEASQAKQLSELLFAGKGERFQLAVELEIPQPVVKSLNRKNGRDGAYVVRYEVEIGHRYLPTTPPQIIAENLWLIDAAKLVETESPQLLEFPAPIGASLDLVHSKSKTPAGWRKVASKSSEQNAYFRSETSEWNFTLKNGSGRSALSSLPEEERFGIANWAKTTLLTSVHKIALQSQLMQAPCSPLKDRTFKADGSNLPLLVRDLKADSGRYAAWLEHLQTVLPIQDVEWIERPEDKQTYVKLKYAGDLAVPSWHVSDGTLRLLALTMLPYLNLESAAFLIEEPENGIHPQAMEAVFQSLSSIYHGQALVATHSPVFVGLIKPAQLLCFGRTQSGETAIVTGDRHPKLLQWQGDFRLAQLFAAGVLS